MTAGRPSYFTGEKGRLMVALITRNFPIQEACNRLGISVSCLAGWRRRYPDFSASFHRALMEREGRPYRQRIPRQRKRSGVDPFTVQRITERLARGRTIADICRDGTMPSRATIYKWMHDYPEFNKQIEEARNAPRK